MSLHVDKAGGYLCILAPPLLLMASLESGMPALALGMLIVVAPLLRVVFGEVRDGPPEWTEVIAVALDFLPVVCAGVYLGAVVFAVWRLRTRGLTDHDLAWFGASLWAAFVFASCVAHELVHRTTITSRNLGRVLSGVIGYPLLEYEHRAHHAQGANVCAAEWPRVEETLWPFTARRLRHVCRTAWEGHVVLGSRRRHPLTGGLPISVGATVTTAAAFGIAVGEKGLILYAIVALAVAWTLQAVTYIQHWGLGDDHVPDAAGDGLAWEDLCQLQAWLTLSISYHQAHHSASTVPYYRQRPMLSAPRAPAGYVVLLFASLVPSIWRALMFPALERWKREPCAQRTPGRRLVCVGR